MDAFMILIGVYVAVGVFLLYLSVRLAERIRSARIRAAIYAAVFALWFCPGLAGGNGGVAPAPILMLLWTSTAQLIEDWGSNSDNRWHLHYYLSGLFWGGVIVAIFWAVAYGLILGTAHLRQDPPKDGET